MLFKKANPVGGGGKTNSLKPKKAFTLSEVLITLVIIGIIAAIVLPISIYNYKKNFIETRLKKAYSTLANAINISIAHNGQPEQWVLDDEDTWARQYLLPYLKVGRYCGKTTGNGCTFSMGNNNDYRKKITSDVGSSYSRFYMADGIQIAFKINKNTNSDNVLFYIDIDGNDRGENKYGKDVFLFQLFSVIYNERINETISKSPSNILLKPFGFGNSDDTISVSHANSCAKGKAGKYCSVVIMQNNWKIPKDYPL